MMNCVLCGNSLTEIVLSGPNLLADIPGEYEVVRCTNCGLARTEPQISPSDVAEYYAPKDAAQAGKAARSAYYQAHLARRLDKAVVGSSSRYVLDVGSGEGLFLDLMRKKGWSTKGIEISERSVRYAHEALELDIVSGDFRGFDGEDCTFDAVVMSHMLEHFPDPVEALRKANRLLKPGGVLLLALPNCGSLECRLFKENWYPWCLPSHLYHFDPYTIGRALYATGFGVRRITYLPFFLLPHSLHNRFLRHTSKQQVHRDTGRKPVRKPSELKDHLITAAFKMHLTMCSAIGQTVPGEIMEIQAVRE